MRLRDPIPIEESLVAEFRSMGGVLDFAFVSGAETGNDADSRETHRQAAELGLQAMSKRRLISAQVEVPSSAGIQRTFDDFVNWRYDREQRRLCLRATREVENAWRDVTGVTKRRTTDGKPLVAYQWVGDDNPENLQWFSERPGGQLIGSFIDPPYGLRAGPEEIQELFAKFDDDLFCRPQPDSTMWLWEGGAWAEYFLPGLDWWGAWVATLRTFRSQILVIGAATTD